MKPLVVFQSELNQRGRSWAIIRSIASPESNTKSAPNTPSSVFDFQTVNERVPNENALATFVSFVTFVPVTFAGENCV
ncbi:MAG: hypothetical protein EBU22_07080, partial [Actinobacteria bacterium]|nr:hypothetical protein [Actinomycetota bacterium]